MAITLLQHIAQKANAVKLLSPFLAERTNGRTYTSVVSVCRRRL